MPMWNLDKCAEGFYQFVVVVFNQCFCLCSWWEGAVPSLGEELGLHTHRSSAGWTNLQVILKRGELESKANIQGEFNKLEVKPSKTSWSAKKSRFKPRMWAGPALWIPSGRALMGWAAENNPRVLMDEYWPLTWTPSLNICVIVLSHKLTAKLSYTDHALSALLLPELIPFYVKENTHTQTSAAALMAPTTQWISGRSRTRKQELLASNPTYYPFSREDFPWKPCLAWDCCCNVF